MLVSENLEWIKKVYVHANRCKKKHQQGLRLQAERDALTLVEEILGVDHRLHAITLLRLGDAYYTCCRVEQARVNVLRAFDYYKKHKEDKTLLKQICLRLIIYYRLEEDSDNLLFFYEKLVRDELLKGKEWVEITHSVTSFLDPKYYEVEIEEAFKRGLANVKNDVDKSSIALSLGSFYVQMGKLGEGIDCLEEGVRSYPYDPTYLFGAYVLLFNLYYKKKDVANYILYYRKVKELDPQISLIHELISKKD